METVNFKNLLYDLYLIYNEDKIENIDSIVKSNEGKEFDAVKTIYFKYNFRQSPFYDKNVGTDKHIKYLIDSYSLGQRVLAKEFVDVKKNEQQQEEELNKSDDKLLFDVPFDIQIKFNFDSSNLNIPTMNNFIFSSIGQRIITTNKDESLVAMEIIDILDDYISNPNKPIREIILEKK